MKKCSKIGCMFYYVTLLANIGLIVAFLGLFVEGRGDERMLALLFTLPPLFALIVLINRPDKEERALKKRIKKAHLRKELAELKDFDTPS